MDTKDFSRLEVSCMQLGFVEAQSQICSIIRTELEDAQKKRNAECGKSFSDTDWNRIHELDSKIHTLLGLGNKIAFGLQLPKKDEDVA